MTNRTELLNWLVKRHNLKSYIEIGCQNKANNFHKISVPFKLCVDPDINARADVQMTSDDFFSHFSKGKAAKTFDLAFVDGWHEAQQVKRDFDSSINCLNEGGFIVLHDTLPENEQGTLIPRVTKQWWGSCYRFAMNLSHYKGINYYTINMDNGCTVVWKTGEVKAGEYIEYTWNDYLTLGQSMLKVIQPSEIERYIR